jgi:hypothetical protein
MDAALKTYTPNQIEVGARLYQALVHHVAENGGKPIVYSELLAFAQGLYPHDAVLQKAIATSIGDRLLYVASLCKALGYPNLACLGVSVATGEPGGGYTGDWEADKRAVAAWNWADSINRPAGLSDAEAGARWFAWFNANRKACADLGADDKKPIVTLMMQGVPAAEAARHVRLLKTAAA